MTTEILSVIIMVGAVIVFIANRQLRNMRIEHEELNSPQVVNDDAARIRQELEETANEIIERMAIRIDRLEVLLREADRKANLLQNRLDKLNRLEGKKMQETLNDPTFSYLLDEAVAQETIVDIDQGKPEPPRQEEPVIPPAVASAVRDSQVGRAMREALGGMADPDTYSMELQPDEVEAYIKSRSVDEIPDTPIESIVDGNADVKLSPEQDMGVPPAEQAAYLMAHMRRR